MNDRSRQPALTSARPAGAVQAMRPALMRPSGLQAAIRAGLSALTALGTLFAASVALSACGGPPPTTVLAASSLANALEPLAGDDVRFAFAGSPSLVSQLDAGVPAALLLVADSESMRSAVATGRIHGEPVRIATNRLVLATPVGNPGDVVSLADLARPDLIVGLCAPQVPCGRLAAAELAEAGVAAAVDTEESSVAGLAAKLSLGEVDVGLVYATDAETPGLAVVDEPALGRRSELWAAAVDRELSGPAAKLWDSLISGVLADHGFDEP